MRDFIAQLTSQLVEHCTGISEVTGSNPIDALVFQASSFRLPKSENLLQWPLFNCSTNINFFTYTLHQRDKGEIYKYSTL